MKHSLLFVAVLLVVVWLIARVVLAVTSFALHLLWIVAIIAVVVWLVRRGSGST